MTTLGARRPRFGKYCNSVCAEANEVILTRARHSAGQKFIRASIQYGLLVCPTPTERWAFRAAIVAYARVTGDKL